MSHMVRARLLEFGYSPAIIFSRVMFFEKIKEQNLISSTLCT